MATTNLQRLFESREMYHRAFERELNKWAEEQTGGDVALAWYMVRALNRVYVRLEKESQ